MRKNRILAAATYLACWIAGTTIPAVATDVLQFGSREGMYAVITGKSGIGSSKAMIRGHVSEEGAKEYCEGYER